MNIVPSAVSPHSSPRPSDLTDSTSPQLSADSAEASCLECLEQAEVCREQARAAVRLKRFKAARGLFSTAAALCRRALSICGERLEARRDANERLRQIEDEMKAYGELDKSLGRPLKAHAVVPSKSDKSQ